MSARAAHFAPESDPEPEERGSYLQELLWMVVPVALACVAAWLLHAFVFQFYVVPTSSMATTIEPGDTVFALRTAVAGADVEPGDIVTFKNPEGGDELVKRVIAVGGQTVDIRDGAVYVDGEKLDEPYTQGLPTYSMSDSAGSAGIAYPYTVPEGTFWYMGDNRTRSKDARYFGPASTNDVTSKVQFTFWPLDHAKML